MLMGDEDIVAAYDQAGSIIDDVANRNDYSIIVDNIMSKWRLMTNVMTLIGVASGWR